MTCEHHCKHWPRHIITTWAIYVWLHCSLDILQAPCSLITPLQYELISDVNSFLSETCFHEEWMFGRRIIMTLLGTLPIGHLRVSSELTMDLRRTGNLNTRSRQVWPVTTSPSGHASHQYAPRGRRQERTRPVRLKGIVSLGHPPLALAANRFWSFDRTRSCRMQFLQLPIGV